MKYYFLMASLPALSPDAEPPLASDALRHLFVEHFHSRDLVALEELDARRTPPQHPFVVAWLQADTFLRNAIARQRASKSGVNPAPFIRQNAPFDPATERMAADAMLKNTPLERERALDRVRWNILDDLSGFDPFDTNAALAYAVKLSIVERWHALSDEEGSNILNAAVSSGLSSSEDLNRWVDHE